MEEIKLSDEQLKKPVRIVRYAGELSAGGIGYGGEGCGGYRTDTNNLENIL